jgi:molecular chaperone DnaK
MARDNRTLGRFRLEGMAPAPRGIPQIEVTFDIDANGILNVSARDKATSREQRITISGSTQLSKEEIDRMVQDAASHTDEDRRKRELVEARNQADSLAYQVERSLKDLGDKVPSHEKARVEQLISEIRQAIKEEAPIERLRQLTSDLQQVAHGIASAAYGQTASTAPGGSSGDGRATGTVQEDVIDAEFKPSN